MSLAKKAISNGGNVAARAEKGVIREQRRREAGGAVESVLVAGRGETAPWAGRAGNMWRQHDGAAQPGADGARGQERGQG